MVMTSLIVLSRLKEIRLVELDIFAWIYSTVAVAGNKEMERTSPWEYMFNYRDRNFNVRRLLQQPFCSFILSTMFVLFHNITI